MEKIDQLSLLIDIIDNHIEEMMRELAVHPDLKDVSSEHIAIIFTTRLTLGTPTDLVVNFINNLREMQS